MIIVTLLPLYFLLYLLRHVARPRVLALRLTEEAVPNLYELKRRLVAGAGLNLLRLSLL